VKGSGRDESIWVVIHKCMEAMLGVSLYSYLYLSVWLAKILSFLCFFFNKIGEESRTGSAWKQGRWEGQRESRVWGRKMAQTRYAHVNKTIKK
jgi:hypothetical protein